MTLWQELHETVPSTLKRGSKYSICPKLTFAGEVGFSGGSAGVVGSGSNAWAAALHARAKIPIQRGARILGKAFMRDSPAKKASDIAELQEERSASNGNRFDLTHP
jgi:hypothetical protein